MTDLHECTGPERDAEEVAQLWQFAQQRGMDRKRFLEALSDGGLTAALAVCMDFAGPNGTARRRRSNERIVTCDAHTLVQGHELIHQAR